MGSSSSSIEAGADGERKTTEFAPSPSCTNVERIEFWQAPLANRVAAAAGGLHSFLAIWTSDLSVHLVEKLSNGEVYFDEVDAKELSRRKEGAERFKLATASSLKPHLRLYAIKRWAERHEGEYDIHSNNCHLLAAFLWNKSVADDAERLQKVPQRKLSRMAKRMGMNSLIRKAVSQTVLSGEEKEAKREQRRRELRQEARERLEKAERKKMMKKLAEEKKGAETKRGFLRRIFSKSRDMRPDA